MLDKQYAVRAARCRHTAANEEVYETLRRITDPLTRSWEKLAKANRIAIKFNMMMEPNHIHYFAGRRRELVDDAVARAVLRLLRERTSARLVAVDSYGRSQPGVTDAKLNYMPLLDEFEVGYAESNLPPFATYEVPGGGGMFKRYTLNACFQDADEVVSVAKMKNHLFMGITLCMKNLFGLPPTVPPEGRVRSYFHHAIRLSYVLPDLARITRPCLNVIDGLTGQWGREWGGQGRIGDALIAGDQVTATDACAAHLMGVDPMSDWVSGEVRLPPGRQGHLGRPRSVPPEEPSRFRRGQQAGQRALAQAGGPGGDGRGALRGVRRLPASNESIGEKQS